MPEHGVFARGPAQLRGLGHGADEVLGAIADRPLRGEVALVVEGRREPASPDPAALLEEARRLAKASAEKTREALVS